MTDIEKRAHDIAVRLLPELLHEEGIKCLVEDETGYATFNDHEVLNQYGRAYEALLKGLQKYYGF